MHVEGDTPTPTTVARQPEDASVSQLLSSPGSALSLQEAIAGWGRQDAAAASMQSAALGHGTQQRGNSGEYS